MEAEYLTSEIFKYTYDPYISAKLAYPKLKTSNQET